MIIYKQTRLSVSFNSLLRKKTVVWGGCCFFKKNCICTLWGNLEFQVWFINISSVEILRYCMSKCYSFFLFWICVVFKLGNSFMKWWKLYCNQHIWVCVFLTMQLCSHAEYKVEGLLRSKFNLEKCIISSTFYSLLWTFTEFIEELLENVLENLGKYCF